VKILQDLARLRHAARQGPCAVQRAFETPARKACARDDMTLAFRKHWRGKAAGTRIGHQHHALALRQQGGGQGFGRKKMPASAAGGDHDRALHIRLHE